MLYFKNGKWNFCTEKVRYIQHGEETTQYVGQEGHDWWVDFEEKWEHTEIIEFIEVELPTVEQLERLAEINELGIPDGFGTMVENYVIHGEFPEGINHPLRILQLQKKNEQLLVQLAQTTAETLEVMTTLHEIQKIEQAEANAELIELMMMLGGM